jgi:hypothetical protein
MPDLADLEHLLETLLAFLDCEEAFGPDNDSTRRALDRLRVAARRGVVEVEPGSRNGALGGDTELNRRPRQPHTIAARAVY